MRCNPPSNRHKAYIIIAMTGSESSGQTYPVHFSQLAVKCFLIPLGLRMI